MDKTKVKIGDMCAAIKRVTAAEGRCIQAQESGQAPETIATLRAAFREALVRDWPTLKVALESTFDGDAGRRRVK